MKPRNKFEKAVLAQSEKLPTISKAQVKWAFRECIDHYAHRLPKGRTTCMDCGHNWHMAEQTEDCTCPACRARLKVQLSYVRKVQQKQYFTVLTTSGVYQVLRMFLLVVEMEKGCKAVPQVIEIGQYWWNEQGRKAIVGIQRVLGKYLDTFSFASPMAIRQDNIAYDHISYAPIYPKSKAIDTLRRNGFDGDFHGIVPTSLIPALLSDSRAETLMKAGQYQMLRHYLKSSFDMERYWASVKICIRNGYTIPDGSMWRDYIDLLQHFGKDTNSPKYVCPQDLKAEHDKWVEKRNRQRIREQTEEQRMKAVEDEKEYLKAKGIFFGLVFTDSLICVKVIESVEEMILEGKAMHHCVGGYHRRKDSLIFSATINGKRIETVEVSLKTLQVVQSRGVCNSNTEYHDRIITLVENNAELIRKRMKEAA
ncbi:MAG: PcfJ domain-containing protein [Paraprevotella clara]|nr:PcfJ domain-containing protein [Paraprevotella clara]